MSMLMEVVAVAAEVAVEVAMSMVVDVAMGIDMSMVVDVAMGIDMSDIPLISILAYVMNKLRGVGVGGWLYIETKCNGILV